MCEIDIVIINNTEYDFELDTDEVSPESGSIGFQVNDGEIVEGSEPPSVIKKMSEGVFSVSGPEGSAPNGKVFYCNKERSGEKVGLILHWTSGASATANASVSGETTAFTEQETAPWSTYIEVWADADSWTFTVQQTPASYAVPGRAAGKFFTPLVAITALQTAYHVNEWTKSDYDTVFTKDSQTLLKKMRMFNIRLIRDPGLKPTSEKIEWTQASRSLFGCEETYLLVDYYQQGNRGRKFKVFIEEGTTPPNSFETSGYQKKLHFGFLTFGTDDGAVFFVIHPNSWGPYQHRFKTNTFTAFTKNAVAKAASIGTSSAIGAALGSVVPGLGTLVGGAIGAVGGVAASSLTDDYFGDYLRYIG